MTEILLKAKHWQLFVLSFGIPMFLQSVAMNNMLNKMVAQENPDPSIFFASMWYLPILMILTGGILFGWLWAVGTGLQSKLPAGVKMNVVRFKIFFFIPLIYLAFVAFFIVRLFNDLSMNLEAAGPEFEEWGRYITFILPIHFFAIFCILHTIYFAAKTFKTAELQREVSFSDFVGEFFLIWFYFIGVWIIQPKINQMDEEI